MGNYWGPFLGDFFIPLNCLRRELCRGGFPAAQGVRHGGDEPALRDEAQPRDRHGVPEEGAGHGEDGRVLPAQDGDEGARAQEGRGVGREAGNSIEICWLEFWLEKPHTFLLEIPYTKKS